MRIVPVAAVFGVIAVITEHKIMPVWHHPLPGWLHTTPVLLANLVCVIAQLLSIQTGPAQAARLLTQQRFSHPLAIDVQLLVKAVSNNITGHADHTLDVVDTRVFRIFEHHDITPLRITQRNDFLVDYWQADTIRKLVYQNKVTHLQGWNHRPRGNLKRLEQKRTQYKHDRQYRKQGLAILNCGWLLVQPLQNFFVRGGHLLFVGFYRLAAPWRQPQAVSQRQRSADSNSNDQNKRKVQIHDLVIHPQYGKESFLWYFHITHLFHALFTGLLFFQQFFLAADITTITLGQYIFTQCLDVGSGNYLSANGSLNGHIIHLSRNQFFHFFCQNPAFGSGLVTVHNQCQSIHPVTVDQHVQTCQVGHLEAVKTILQRSIATTDRFQPVKEIQHDLVHWQLVHHLHLGAEKIHVNLNSALLDTERNNIAQVLLRYQNGGLDYRFAHFLDQ